MWSVYFLQTTTNNISSRKTYIGASNDVDRRLKQHNREKSGGARATAGQTWKRVCYVKGFPDMRSALQFEWAWKYYSRKHNGNPIQRRIKTLFFLFGIDKPTQNAINYQDYIDDLEVVWEIDKDPISFL
jgi:predicted GIY-YIG superfamily endonuclease